MCALLFTSCDTGSDEPSTTYNYTYTFETQGNFTDQGYWTEVYNTEYTTLILAPNLLLTHAAWEMPEGETDYGSNMGWSGFCPVRGKDNVDHPEGWNGYTWSSVTGSGIYSSVDYMMARWNPSEPAVMTSTEAPACGVAFSGGAQPLVVAVTNSNIAYWAMKSGDGTHAAFGPNDYLRLVFKGVRNSAIVGEVKAVLAAEGQILTDWSLIDLSKLGMVDYFYIQMESNRTENGVVTVPPFFCIDNLMVKYTE